MNGTKALYSKKLNPAALWKKHKTLITDITPLIGMGVLFIIYTILRGGLQFETLINQSAVLLIAGTGAVFIYSMGALDISLGSSVAFSALAGVIVYNRTQNVFLLILVCIVVGITVGMFSSTLAAFFKLPVFIITVAMIAILNSLILTFLNGQPYMRIPYEEAAAIRAFDNMWVRIAFVAAFYLLCYIVFKYMKTGRKNKLLGGSRIVAKQVGISLNKQTYITFLISGLGVGLGAFLSITRSTQISSGTASSLGMDILMAVVFGGMPQSGGARAKVSAGIVGGISITLLTQILNTVGLNTGEIQIVKAVMFLVIVFITSMSFRSKTLYR